MTHGFNQENKIGLGVNVNGSFSLYGYFQKNKHHFGLGASYTSHIYQYNKTDFGSTSYGLSKGGLITGMLFHYRYYPYINNNIFDIFLEGNLSTSFINILQNHERVGTGVSLFTMLGLGFRAKFANRFALTQSTTIGLHNYIVPEHVSDFIKSSPLQNKFTFGISFGLEVHLFKF